jgi:hypothetical protein
LPLSVHDVDHQSLFTAAEGCEPCLTSGWQPTAQFAGHHLWWLAWFKHVLVVILLVQRQVLVCAVLRLYNAAAAAL